LLLAPAVSAASTGSGAPDRAALERFAEQLDKTIARQAEAGIYLRGSALSFPLKGHGVVFVHRAVQSPLGGPAAYLKLLERRGPGMSAAPGTGELVGATAVRAASEFIEKAAAAIERTQLTRANEEAARLARQLARLTASRAREAAAGASAAPSAPSGPEPFRVLEIARLEAAVAALQLRVESIEVRIEKRKTGQDGTRVSAPRDQRDLAAVDRVVEDLVNVVLARGREVTRHPNETLSVVLLLSPVGPLGNERVGSTVQISARRSDLPTSDDPAALEASRRKVRVSREPF
jgi:hypothetical protein